MLEFSTPKEMIKPPAGVAGSEPAGDRQAACDH